MPTLTSADQMMRDIGRVPIGQELHDLAARELLLKEPPRRIADAHSSEDRSPDYLAAVGLQVAFDAHDTRRSRGFRRSRTRRKTPVIAHGQLRVDDAVVLGQVFRNGRRFCPLGW